MSQTIHPGENRKGGITRNEEISKKLFTIQAILETAAIAAYHLQDEPNLSSMSVSIGLTMEHAAKLCEETREILE